MAKFKDTSEKFHAMTINKQNCKHTVDRGGGKCGDTFWWTTKKGRRRRDNRGAAKRSGVWGLPPPHTTRGFGRVS